MLVFHYPGRPRSLRTAIPTTASCAAACVLASRAKVRPSSLQATRAASSLWDRPALQLASKRA